ncbi:hypothetical protein PHYSODRAFT_284483 [Phytophthora sojae]|uniref:RxLR effector protein n=2 Tax=Phytophthora sojae TaxID=67593 RepID=G4YQ77_PHYSP|nr:hypothetical protein PHYSODRAFT_284483 [Phytophthora sojae]AEK81077.1 Avh268 [Phytophthora sojae]AEK81078.1 Avh268 [Phytophthora sojae]EGZ29581.1 hypothetical protein PHYSODRAFT_284483 [Phytophthora sojae]|eukprot:XP_009516856.1 hypothetical protein PHYSODRAFT_284483 [Phytophthora sojae]
MRFHHLVLPIAAMLVASAQAAPTAHQNQVQGAIDNKQSGPRFLRVDKTADDEERAGEVYHLSKSEKSIAFVKTSSHILFDAPTRTPLQSC